MVKKEEYTYSQVLGLEIVKSQFGAPVIAILVILLTTVGTGALLVILGWDKLMAVLDPDESAFALSLTDIQKLGLLLVPVAPFLVLLGAPAALVVATPEGRSLLEKAADLNIGNRILGAFT